MKTASAIEKNTPTLTTEEIWIEFGDRLRRFIYSKVSDRDIVNDIIQDIFYKIHSNINNLKNNSKLTSWLFQIARNAIIDYFREEKRATELLKNMEQEDTYVKKASTEILKYCMTFFLSRLPKKYEEAIIFTEFKGNSQIELAKKEGISVSAAKSRVQRAKKQLKEVVTAYSSFESHRDNIDVANIDEYCPLSKT